MSGPRVHVHIDALALGGFAPAQRDQLVRGLRAELARQFATGGADMAPRSLSSLTLGIATAPGASASHIGRDAARRIARSIRG